MYSGLLLVIAAQYFAYPSLVSAAGSEGDEDTEFYMVEVVFICTVFAIVMIEEIIHALEQKAKRRQHLQEIIFNMYKELMVLGLAALGIFVLNQTHIADGVAGITHTFEVIHYTLFLVAVCHTFFVCVLVFMSERISKYWDRVEELEFNHWRELRADYDTLIHDLGLKGHLHTHDFQDRFKRLSTALLHPRMWFRLAQLTENVRFHDIRHHFIRANHLPKNFHFVTYLKKCKQHVTLHLTAIHRGVWLGIAWLISADLMLRGVIQEYREGFVGVIVITLAVVSILLFLAITHKTGTAYWRLLHSELVHFDAANPSTLTFRNVQGDQRSLFWLGRPQLLLNCLQLGIFLISTCVALLIQNASEIHDNQLLTPSIVMTALAASTSVFILPKMVPQYTMITHTGQFVDLERLSDALEKQQRKFHSKALATIGASSGSLPNADFQTLTLSEMRTIPHQKTSPRAKLLTVLKSSRFVSVVDVLLLLDFFVIAYDQVELQVTHKINTHLISLELFFGSLFMLEISLNIYARGIGPYFEVEGLPRLLSATLATYSFCVTIVVFNLPYSDLQFWLHASTIFITFRFFRRFQFSNHKHPTMVEIMDSSLAITAFGESSPRLSDGLESPVHIASQGEQSRTTSDLASSLMARTDARSSVDPEHYIMDYDPIPTEGKEELTVIAEDLQPGKHFSDRRESTAKELESARLNKKHALAQELWEETNRQHPEIAAAHGKISIPILRLMLGLPAFKKQNLPPFTPEVTPLRHQAYSDKHKTQLDLKGAEQLPNENPTLRRNFTSPALLSPAKRGSSSPRVSSLLTTLEAQEKYWNKVLKFGKVLKKTSSGAVDVRILVLTRHQIIFIQEGSQSLLQSHQIMDLEGLILDHHQERMTLNTIITMDLLDQDGSKWIRLKTPDSTILVRDFEDKERDTKDWKQQIENTIDLNEEH